MLKKSKRFMVVALMFVFLSSNSAQASSHYFWFGLDDNYSTSKTSAYPKDDDEQNWYITLLRKDPNTNVKSNMSSTNILRCRLLKNGKTTYTKDYTFSNYVQSYKLAYNKTVKKGYKMSLSAKKDDASTSSAKLKIAGKFAP